MSNVRSFGMQELSHGALSKAPTEPIFSRFQHLTSQDFAQRCIHNVEFYRSSPQI
jgi:hypothetical protein